jgi:hypothetical protein
MLAPPFPSPGILYGGKELPCSPSFSPRHCLLSDKLSSHTRESTPQATPQNTQNKRILGGARVIASRP